jgi:proteasome lid subunit RPN8/RPN11
MAFQRESFFYACAYIRVPSTMEIVFSEALRQTLYQQLAAAYPNEAGGFLLGVLADGQLRLQEVRPIANIAASEEQYHRYLMTPSDWAKLEDEADAKGLSLVGYYHSHPNAPAIPSEYDRVHALPNFLYLITSVRDGQPVEIRAWRLTESRQQFDELSIHVFPAGENHV